jgi:hypothetical protein
MHTISIGNHSFRLSKYLYDKIYNLMQKISSHEISTSKFRESIATLNDVETIDPNLLSLLFDLNDDYY